jgi:hypothetical protein
VLDQATLTTVFNLAGAWVGFVLTLLIASLLIGDNGLARVAQHLLVGTSVGYASVMAIQLVLRPRLFARLWQAPTGSPRLWVVLGLGVLLLVAGIERSLRQGQVDAGASSRGRLVWSGLAAIPVALLLGIGVAAGLLGVLQGNDLAPNSGRLRLSGRGGRHRRAACWGALWHCSSPIAVLLHLTLHPVRHVASLPRPLQGFVGGWLWIGQRALWLAAGMIFARLFASRLSLLIDRVSYLLTSLTDTGLQRWLEAIWSNLIR